MPRRNFASGSPWESLVGYSRAVKVGNLVFVAGTAALDERGKLVGRGDPCAQTLQNLEQLPDGKN